eukprot:gene15700-biopygen12258
MGGEHMWAGLPRSRRCPQFMQLSHAVLSCVVLSYAVLSCAVLSFAVLSCVVLSFAVLSCVVLSFAVLSCVVLSCVVPARAKAAGLSSASAAAVLRQ